MSFPPILTLPFAALLFCVTCEITVAQEPKEKPPTKSIEELIELAKPGPQHELLASYAGKWQATLTINRGDKQPESKGKMNCYMTMEGRFLWIGYDVRGQAGKYKGAFLIGFDRRNEQYSLVALDTNGTYFVTSQGKKGESGREIRMRGTDDDPHMKSLGFTKEFVHVLDIRKPETFSVEILFVDTRTPERKESPAMKFQFTQSD